MQQSRNQQSSECVEEAKAASESISTIEGFYKLEAADLPSQSLTVSQSIAQSPLWLRRRRLSSFVVVIVRRRHRSSSSSSSSPPFPSSFVVAVRRRSSPFAVVRCCRRRRRRCRHRLLSLSLSSLFDDDAHRRPSHIARCRCLLIVVVTACIKGCACCAIVSLP